MENRIIFPGNEANRFRTEHKGLTLVPADDTVDSHRVSLPAGAAKSQV